MASESFGRIDGKFDVDAHGGATYAIPIQVPPGTNGLQPSLQLVYNSHLSELGYTGVGWRLAGLSAITRVPATIAQDGVIGRIEYGAGDRFALDGARLMAVEGEYGAANAVYRTEVEQWMKVVPKAASEPGRSGPDSFTVYSKDLARHEFGNSDDSRVLANTAPEKPRDPSVRTWLVNRITDRNGNFMTFRYTQDAANNVAYPESIVYGGNEQTGVAGQREVRFTYTALPADSPDAARQFAGKYGFAVTRLLTGISTYVSGQLVLTYRIAYMRDGISRRSRISGVMLADRDGNTLPATTFTWQDGAPSFFGKTASVALPGNLDGTFLPMDVNGDGIVDIVNAYSRNDRLALDLYLGRGDGTFEAPVSIPLKDLAGQAMLFPLDIDADGCTDLVHAYGENDRLVLTVLHAKKKNGQWTLEQGPPLRTQLLWPAILVSVDFDGDGKIDLVHCSGDDDQLVLCPLRSNGTSFDPLAKNTTGLPWFDRAPLIPIDFDGDGKGDLAYATSDGDAMQIRLLRSDGNRFTPESTAIGDVPFSPVLFALDANQDGKPDLVTARMNGDTLEVRTLLSNGIGLEAAQLSTFPLDSASMPQLLPARLTGGLPDLLVKSIENDVVKIRVFSSNGARFVERGGVTQPFRTSLDGVLLPADVDGDGRTDLLAIGRARPGDSNVTFTSVLVAGAVPDLVQRITDGFGEHVSVVYKPLTDPSVYRKAETPLGAKADPRALLGRGVSGATFDLRSGASTAGTTHSTMNVQFAKMVVSSYERPGAGAQRFHFDRFYTGARVDLTGRGWLGFESMTIRERGRDTKRVTTYRQDFPFAGSPLVDELRGTGADERLFERTKNTYEEVMHDRKTHETRLRMQSKETFGGPAASATPDLIETSEFAYGDFGNMSFEAVTTNAANNRAVYTHHTYGYADRASWKLGLETELRITSDRDGNDVLVHRKFAYDGRANRTTEEVRDAAHDRWLKTEYQHDAYGNETSMKAASGALTSKEYDDALHTFPRRTTQPANAAGVRLIVDREYDPAFGVDVSTSQPYVAGMPVRTRMKHELDGFGRVIATLEPRPDGSLITQKKIVRGRDDNGPFEEEQSLQDWAGTQWRKERKYSTSTGAVFLTRMTGPDGQRDVIVERTLDSEARSVEETLLRYAGTPARKVLRKYDELGRLVRLERPLANGGTTVAETKCLSATEEHSTEAVNTPSARLTKRTYGYFGGKRMVVKRVDALEGVTTFDYDARARSISGTDPKGVVTTAAYDFADRQIALEVRSGNHVETKETVDHDDEKIEMLRTDGRGLRVLLRHDAMNRLLSRGLEGGEATVFTYDDVSRPNTLSRLAKVTIPGGAAVEYDYDHQGNRAMAEVTVDGAKHKLTTSFTPAAQAERLTYPDNSVVRNVYNVAGSVVAIDDGLSTRYASYADFTATGKAQRVELLNGTVESLPYNDVGQLQSQVITGPGGAKLAHASMQWNEIYQLREIADALNPHKTQTFFYDKVGRLLRATGDYAEPQEFAYDLAGNLTKRGAVAFDVEGHQVRSGRTAAGEVYRADYDAAGNLTRSQKNGEERTFRFDADSQLVESGGTTFLYDHTGARILKRSADGVTTRYIAGLYEVTTFPGGARQSTVYIQGPHGVLASKTKAEAGTPAPLRGVPSAGTYFFHTNHINSTTVQTDAAGAEVCRVEYLPFGEIRRIAGRDIFRQKFTGNEFDYETGLYYFKSRYYDASIGRFISADDRLGGEIDRHDVFNRYAYVLNNPVSEFDPEGHSLGLWLGIGFAALAVVGVVATIATAGIATPWVAAAASAAAGAFTGAMTSAAAHSFMHQDKINATDLLVEMAIGAASGVVGTGMSALAMKGLGVGIQFGLSAASLGKLTLVQAAKITLAETISGAFVGATYASMGSWLHGEAANTKDVFTKAGWGAAGGLLAGAALSGAVRAVQKPVKEGFATLTHGLTADLMASGRSFYIPSPSNIYVREAVHKLVHVPRNVFGAVSKQAAAAVG